MTQPGEMWPDNMPDIDYDAILPQDEAEQLFQDLEELREQEYLRRGAHDLYPQGTCSLAIRIVIVILRQL